MSVSVSKYSKSITILDEKIGSELKSLISDAQADQLLIASPFIIGDAVVDMIVEGLRKRTRNAARMHLLLVTKFDLVDFVCGASDLEAIRRIYELSENECQEQLLSSTVYNLPSLHAKLFLTNQQAIIGSANLTSAGLYGGNAEICLKVTDPTIRHDLKDAFIRLVDQASAVDLSFLELKKKQLQALADEQADYKDLYARLNKFQIAARLCRIPVQESKLELADYYGQMRAYLKWIQHRNGQKLYSNLKRKMAETLDGTNSNKESRNNFDDRLANLRIDFLKSIGVIQFPTQRTVSLTNLGKEVVCDTKSARKKIFRRILRWCEIEHHDRCLRDLMRPLSGLADGHYETIESLKEKVDSSNTSTPEFREKTSPARGWLQSLGVLHLEEGSRPYRYRRGPNFPSGEGNFDDRINAIVGIKEDLQWLRED